jgi:hypothetical protein
MIAEFISIVVCAFRDHQFRLRFFFTSRVEEHIRERFATSPVFGITYCLRLHDFDADNDLYTFFRSRFTNIHQQKCRLMGNIRIPRPSVSDLTTLVKKCSGSFIFASTLVNFVNDGGDLPHRKLQIALQGHCGLDPLYTEVLQSASRGRYFTRVLETIIIIPEPVSIIDLAFLLQIENGDVILALQGVQSIIMMPEDNEQPVWLFHTSLRDFLTTQAHSESFFINPVTCHLSAANDCLVVMSAHHGDMIYANQMLQYAARKWCHHLLFAIEEGSGGDFLFSQDGTFLFSQDGTCMMNTLTGFVSQAFDPWINSIIMQVNMVDTLETLESVLKVSLPEYQLC